MPLTRLPLGTAVSGNLPAANYKAGSVIQTKHKKVDTTIAINTTTYTDITGASLSITPLFSSSKILITAHAHLYVQDYSTDTWRGALIKILRDSTSIYQDPTGGYGTGAFIVANTDRYMVHQAYTYLDSPATTSEITYKYQYKSKVSGVNISVNHANYGAPGHITLQEIAQ